MARKKTDLPTLALLLAMYALLLGNFVWYALAPTFLVLHVLVGALAIHLAFTIWHEAVHDTVSSRKWVNDVVGVLGMLPYMTPYFMQKWVHLEHHRKLNERDDPNVIYTDGSFLTLPLRYHRALGYARKVLGDDPRSPAERASDRIFLVLIGGVYGVAWWQGFLLEALLLWLLPVVIAKVVMDWYVNYLPHVGLPPGRFAGTRIVEVGWLTPLVLGHNYHAIHHLWPPVPWYRYRSVFRRKREYLERNGVPIEHRVFGGRAKPVRSHGSAARTG